MPTYYACGAIYDDDGDGQLDEDCPDCENGYGHDDDEASSSSDAYEAIGFVDGMTDYPDMSVPGLYREVSCEWEASSGVMTALAAVQGLQGGFAADHHSDVTCDGEIIFPRLRLWDDGHARAYSRSVAVIDRLRAMGSIRVGFDAGHHVHVSARDDRTGKGLSANTLISLYSVFAHCEDLLYRFASAGWSEHRSERDGTYSSPLIKIGSRQRTVRSIGTVIGQDRYQGLNVTPYLANIQQCRCGAYRFAEWESCECSDHRATIEWRLWNAAVSPRKIRAYIAISAALTEYAATVDVRDVVDLDENPFTGTGTVDEKALLRQLNWLSSRHTFTGRDREDIYWLASISPGMGSIGRAYEASRASSMSYAADPSPVDA